MKRQQSQCKQHGELIQQLLNQNTVMKQKYQNLLNQYEKLRYKYKKLSQNCSQTLVKQVQQAVGIKQIDDLNILQGSGQYNSRSVRYSHNFKNQVGGNAHTNSHLTHGLSRQIKSLNQAPNQSSRPQTKPVHKITSRSSSRSSSFTQKSFPLIQGCFIIEKKKCYEQKTKNCLSQMLQFVYPEQLAKTQKQTLQMMLKYTLQQPQIIKFQDDQFNSRMNEIVYGTPYQDFMFAFEDNKWIMKKDIPQILKLMNTMKKKYFHILVKPEIIENNQIEQSKSQLSTNTDIKNEKTQISTNENQSLYFYQTQVIFGFISPFPLRVFFQDLHRTIQQQLKYSQFSFDQNKQQIYNPSANRKTKYQTVGNIMKKMYDQQYKISKFPIHFVYNTGITKIQLSIPTVVGYREMQDEFLNQVFTKYNGIKICKLLHYVMAEKHVLIQASDQRSLNQIIQMIRIMIRPFLWMFAVVYVYSDYFQPFMSSPMPIIIGKVSQKQKLPNNQKIQNEHNSDYSEFCYIKMNSQQQQIKENEPYSKLIKKLKKQWDKCQKDKKQSRASLIHNYVHSLKIFIQKGVLVNSEPTDFHIEFMDTQMVSYYKDTKDDI